VGEHRESIEPDADALADEVEGHALVEDGDVEPDDAVEGHALVEGSD
jgi:hypothetical protein